MSNAIIPESHDYRTHHGDWLRACTIARDSAPTADDASYWQHQINTLDKIAASQAAGNLPDQNEVTYLINATQSTRSELIQLAGVLDESAGNLRGLMDTDKAEELKVREWLPDELEGSAIFLKELASATFQAPQADCHRPNPLAEYADIAQLKDYKDTHAYNLISVVRADGDGDTVTDLAHGIDRVPSDAIAFLILPDHKYQGG